MKCHATLCRSLISLSLTGAIVLGGCGQDSHTSAPVSESGLDQGATTAARQPVPAEDSDPIAPADTSPANDQDRSLQVADVAVFQQVLEQHRGKVVLVDFWATWCVPCKKNFPKVVGYGQKYGPSGLAVVSLSIDDLSARDEVVEFLTSVGAPDTNLISKWGTGTESAEQFGFSGEVPFYRLYDRGGTLRYQFSSNAESLPNVESLEQLEPRIGQLLAEPAGS